MEMSESTTEKNGRQRKHHTSWKMKMNERKLATDLEIEESETLLQGSDNEVGHSVPKVCYGLKDELGNVCLLLFLYVLQGIPLGLAGSIPLILQSKSVSYTDQAFFSFVFWPFSLKLLWAPLVDSIYFQRFGRRKSWLVPTQYLLGLFMLYLSYTVDSLLENDGQKGPDIVTLTAVFFLFEFLAATQDIAVDGWALTMLSRENVDFLFFWGIVFLVTTTLVAIVKKENCEKSKPKEETQGVMETYKLLFSIIKLPTVWTFCVLLLTAKMGFSAADAVTGLKLVEEGVPKEQLALLAVPMVSLYSMYVAVMAFHAKVSDPLIGGTYMTLLNTVTNLGGNWPSTLALWLVDPLTSKECKGAEGQTCGSAEEVGLCTKLGGACVTTFDGYYVESVVCVVIGFGWWFWLGKKMRKLQEEKPSAYAQNSDGELTKGAFSLCTKLGGACVTTFDGYYVESVVCIVIGFGWWFWLGKKMRKLQEEKPSAWQCRRTK
ncbi:UNVERIFIED_CONTAM: hypothetical protein FKN15_046073 [Acipenser sinensis]